MPLCTEEVGYVAKQSNIKNKNNLKFQFNEYLFTIFLYAKLSHMLGIK